MLERSSLPSTSTAEIADTLQRSLDTRAWESVRWRALHDFLPLPSTWQQYLLACMALSVVLGGLLLHVLLSVQIARADFELRKMRDDYARIERQNSELVYQIAQRSSLAQMARLAAQKGYVPATGRKYVARSTSAFVDPVSGDISAAPVVLPIQPAQAEAVPDVAAAPSWSEQAQHWWQDTHQAVGAATNQLWRDITGRVE